MTNLLAGTFKNKTFSRRLKMFGINMVIKHKDQVVRLRPFTKKDMPTLVEYFSSMKVHMFTNGLFAQTLENEEEWYDKNRKAIDSCIWAIQPEGSEVAIGTTGLHQLGSRDNSATSGIIIWDQSYWNKGIASAAHLGRTFFAADYLNILTIKSTVRVANNPSRMALERVGYSVWGTEPVDEWRGGEWLETYHLKWFHPEKVSILFPKGVPEKYQEGIKRAQIALDNARTGVSLP